YLRVRLAFHPYPQLLQPLCNAGRCGPPRPVTGASPWPWVAHAVSGLLRATRSPCSDSLSLRHRATSPPARATRSNSSVHSSTGWPPGPARAESSALGTERGAARRLLGTQHSVLGTRGLPSDRSSAGGFRFCFTPRTGVLFTVPSRYCALSVAAALQPWGVGAPASRRVPRARRYSRATPEARPAAYRALTLCGRPPPGPSARGRR